MAKTGIHSDLAKNGSIGDQSLVANRDMYIDFYHVATGYCVKFKAFLQSFVDQFNSNWSSQEVYGRMDPVMNFQSTSRVTSMSFSVPSVNLEEAKRNFHALEHLIMQLYPTYQGQIIAGSPLMKIKFANFLKHAGRGHSGPDAKDAGAVCAVQGLSFSPDLDPGFYIPSAGMLFPKSFIVDLSFTVLHNHPLGFRRGGKWRNSKYSFPYATSTKGATEETAKCRTGSRVGVGTFNISNSDVPESYREASASRVLGS